MRGMGPRWNAGVAVMALLAVCWLATARPAEGQTVYDLVDVDEAPAFPGGEEALLTFLRDNQRYPTGLHEAGLGGLVVVDVVVAQDGTIGSASVLRGSGHAALDEEAVRLAGSMPAWSPGSREGSRASVRVEVPVRFMPAGVTDSPEVFASVDEMPSFPGGDEQLMDYINSNMRYPSVARQNGIEGLVIVRFVVMEDGRLGDATILRDIGGGAAVEVLRLVAAMPLWIPGRQGGMPVKVHFNLPVSFRIN